MKSDLLDHVQHVIRGYKVSTAQHENSTIKYSNQNLYKCVFIVQVQIFRYKSPVLSLKEIAKKRYFC